jgi:hypothetical protein
MKKHLIILAVLILTFTGCTSSKKITGTTSTDTSNVLDKSDGSSFEKAIIIIEKTESKGISAEYSWLSLYYPGYKTIRQSLTYNNKTPYDVIEIVTADGSKKEVYFDISHFFGKF